MKSKSDKRARCGRIISPTQLTLAVLAATIIFGRGENSTTNSVNSPHGFELQLPPNWVTVNSNLLATIRTFGRSHDSRMPNPDGIYAYQQVSDKDEFSPPYIMVAVKNVGKIPQRFAHKLSVPGRAQKELDAAIRGPMKDLLPDGYRLISATFDTNLYAMRIEMEFQSEFGLLHVMVANFFTERGTLEVTGLVRPSEYATWGKTFDQMIASVRFADWLQYQRRPAVNLSGGATDWLFPISGVVILAVGGFLYIRFLRNRDSASDY